MTRNEIYEMISPCGTIAYLDLISILSVLQYHDPQIGYLLIQRLTANQKLTQQDWILLAYSVNYLPGSPITPEIVESWFEGKCHLTGLELKTFLEYVVFTDGSSPTFIMSESGDFIIAE